MEAYCVIQSNVIILQPDELPNIKGTLGMAMASATTTGAFQNDTHGLANNNAGAATTSYPSMDASRSNSIYKDNGKVTPINLTIRIWQRTA